jgi:hypothetical protein
MMPLMDLALQLVAMRPARLAWEQAWVDEWPARQRQHAEVEQESARQQLRSSRETAAPRLVTPAAALQQRPVPEALIEPGAAELALVSNGRVAAPVVRC